MFTHLLLLCSFALSSIAFVYQLYYGLLNYYILGEPIQQHPSSFSTMAALHEKKEVQTPLSDDVWSGEFSSLQPPILIFTRKTLILYM